MWPPMDEGKPMSVVSIPSLCSCHTSFLAVLHEAKAAIEASKGLRFIRSLMVPGAYSFISRM